MRRKWEKYHGWFCWEVSLNMREYNWEFRPVVSQLVWWAASKTIFSMLRSCEVRTPPFFAKEYFTHHWGIFSLQKCSSAIQVFLWKRLLCWARTEKVMLLSDAKSGGLSFWRTTATMKIDEIWWSIHMLWAATCCDVLLPWTDVVFWHLGVCWGLNSFKLFPPAFRWCC